LYSVFLLASDLFYFSCFPLSNFFFASPYIISSFPPSFVRLKVPGALCCNHPYISEYFSIDPRTGPLLFSSSLSHAYHRSIGSFRFMIQGVFLYHIQKTVYIYIHSAGRSKKKRPKSASLFKTHSLDNSRLSGLNIPGLSDDIKKSIILISYRNWLFERWDLIRIFLILLGWSRIDWMRKTLDGVFVFENSLEACLLVLGAEEEDLL